MTQVIVSLSTYLPRMQVLELTLLVALANPRQWSLVLRAGSLDFEAQENHTIQVSLSDGHVTVSSSLVVHLIDVDDVTITSVEALTETGMLSTTGGDRFTIYGSNFGSIGATDPGIRVLIGGTGSSDPQLEATGCSVGSDLQSGGVGSSNSQIVCTSPQGYGVAHRVLVIVNGSARGSAQVQQRQP